MRKIIILLFLILIPFAFADKTETTRSMSINDTVSVYGKTLTILNSDINGKLKVNVDGVEGIVRSRFNRTTNINEMLVEILNFTYIDSETIDTILKITVKFECGDNYCNSSETSISCCTDCGCDGNLKCIDNICQKEECVIDSDCQDNDPCTIDKCSNIPPRTCSNILIIKCEDNDSCCPSICGPENDTDCAITIEKKSGEKEISKEKASEPEAEKPEELIKEVKDLQSDEKKGIFIMIGTVLLVLITGYFVIIKK